MLDWIKKIIQNLFKKKEPPEGRGFFHRSVGPRESRFRTIPWLEHHSPYRPFYPNSGDLDPRVSTIASGRPLKEVLSYKESDFYRKYGHLTTDLGYGIIYSIIMKAHKNENRSLKSAFREAIARTDDPLLCLIIMKDYCIRQNEPFFKDKFETITEEIFSNRNKFYQEKNRKSENVMDSELLDRNLTLQLTKYESYALDKSKWLFNGLVMDIYPTIRKPLKIVVKIPSRYKIVETKKFDTSRSWVIGQNVVVLLEDDINYRIMDFSASKS